MPFDNEGAKNQLIDLLRQPRRALLLVGSGSSCFVGYPTWNQLLDELHRAVIPEEPIPAGLELLQLATFIKAHLQTYENRTDRQRQYRQFMEDRFRPHSGGVANHATFHRTMVRLGFCGLATTNYDSVIEHAVNHLLNQGGHDHNCTSIDLCARDRKHRVFEYLRSLTEDGPLCSVLHIHGYWENTNELVLTGEDYRTCYDFNLVVQDPDPLANPRPLHTFHRKVVWSLLTTRPVVFIGFSLEDPAFQRMLQFVREDFELPPNPPAHFAVLGAQTEEDRDRNAAWLQRFGVLPIFYTVNTDATGHLDHSQLPDLVEEFGARLGVATAAPAVADITRRMLAQIEQ